MGGFFAPSELFPPSPIRVICAICGYLSLFSSPQTIGRNHPTVAVVCHRASTIRRKRVLRQLFPGGAVLCSKSAIHSIKLEARVAQCLATNIGT
jgi:hypothetical protein